MWVNLGALDILPKGDIHSGDAVVYFGLGMADSMWRGVQLSSISFHMLFRSPAGHRCLLEFIWHAGGMFRLHPMHCHWCSLGWGIHPDREMFQLPMLPPSQVIVNSTKPLMQHILPSWAVCLNSPLSYARWSSTDAGLCMTPGINDRHCLTETYAAEGHK